MTNASGSAASIHDIPSMPRGLGPMASLTLRNLVKKLKSRLRLQGVTLMPSPPSAAGPTGLGRRIHAHFADLGGVELALPQRTSGAEPATFT